MQSQLKAQKPFFKDINILKKLDGNAKNWELPNSILKRKNKFGELPLSDFKSYYTVIVIKTPVLENAC